MTLQIINLMDPVALAVATEDGYVRQRRHDALPLTIINYSEKAAYTGTWNDVTRQCRGLIVHDDGTIVARPWPKFFNYGEHETGRGGLPNLSHLLDARCEVTDKQDGSLGIVYPVGDGTYRVATRGSFASEQALHATELLRTRYAGWTPPRGITVLLEIVYPANRIVLDYGEMDDLILLGGVETESGMTLGPAIFPDQCWLGPRTDVHPHASLREALAAPPRKNAEGLVVRFPDADLLVKIKQQDYVELHRIVTGLNARAVWERCAPDADGLEALLEALPDEFQQWAIKIATELLDQAKGVEYSARIEYSALLSNLAALSTTLSRKDFAMAAQQSPHRALLFLLLDGKDIRPHIWKTLRPSGEQVPRYMGEDVA